MIGYWLPRPRRRATLLGSLLLLAGSLSCGQETALDVVPVPDPNVNDPAELIDQLQTIKIILDEPNGSEGLFAPGSAGPTGGGVIEDVDGDGKLEFWAEYSVGKEKQLPLVRIEQGRLTSSPFNVQFLGISKGEGKTIAAGDVKGVSFKPDQIHQVDAAFNLLANYRSPQVAQIFPENGKTYAPGGIERVVIIFSKRMSIESLEPPGVLAVIKIEDSSVTEVRRLELQHSALSSGADSPSKVDYIFERLEQEGVYEIRVSTAAKDMSGRRLDQVPMTAGSQGFFSRFTVSENSEEKQIDYDISVPVGAGSDCNPELPCSQGTYCDPITGRCLSERCLGCIPPATCDEITGWCVPDCTLNGDAACGEGHICGPDGICQPW